MLLDFRDGIRNSKRLKYILVGIICIPFALVGIGSYFGNHGPSYAAKVNGQEVSVYAFQNAAAQSQMQIQQTFGGRLPEGLDLSSMVNNQAMDAVVQQEVLRQSTAEKGFAVGDEHLAKEILSIDAFVVDGVFDKQRYSEFLQSRGMSAEQFEEQYRSDLLMQQFRNGVVATGFSLGDENELITSLRNQKRLASFIKLDTQAKADSLEITDEEVQTHYDENIEAFNNPQKVKIEYIELNIDVLKDDVETTEEDLEGYFEQNKSRWVVPEKRSASHILLAVDSDASDSAVEEKKSLADELVARIAAGETLAALAPEFSDDPGSADNGGSLGEFGRGVMVSAFEEVAFAMNEGEVSDPVKSEFGFHIIQLDKIIGETGQLFEEVKAEVEDQYRAELAETEFFQASDTLSNSTYENNDSLQPAADETGLELKTTDWIDQNSTEGVGAFPQVIAAALSDDVRNNGLNSEVLTVGDNHAVVLRTIDYEEAKPKLLDEVREDVVKRVQSEKALVELTALAETMVTELEGGAEAEALATANEGEFIATAALERSNTETDRTLVSALFTMPKPAEGSASYRTVTDSNGDVVVVSFTGVEAGESEEAAPVTATAAPATAEYTSLLSAMEADADIEKNEAVLNPEATLQ